MAEDPTDLGGVEPRKKSSFTTYLIVGVIAVAVIGGVMLFTGGNGDKPANSGTNPSTPVVTIPQLKNSVDSLTATVTGLSGRLANLESQMAGIVAPTVTQAEFNSLQTSVNGLSDSVANWSEDLEALEDEVAIPVGGLNYYLFEEDGDAQLYILSDRDGTFIAQVTVAFENPISLNGTSVNDALKNFYNQPWAKDGDYIPTVFYNPTGAVNETWEYTSVTFYSNVLDLEKGEEEEYQIDLDELDNLDEDIDGVWIEVYPALETKSSGGLFN